MPQFAPAAPAAASRIWRAAVAVALLLLPVGAWAQQPQRETGPDLSVVPEAEALRPAPASFWSDTPIVIFDTAPTFRGGTTTKLVSYIQQQVHWPEAASDLPAGRIFASFWIDATGQLRNIRIVHGRHPLLDAEVLRVIHGLTGFTPAKQGNKPLAVEMTIPVLFKIR